MPITLQVSSGGFRQVTARSGKRYIASDSTGTVIVADNALGDVADLLNAGFSIYSAAATVVATKTRGAADYDVFLPFSPAVCAISGITTGGVATVSSVISGALVPGMFLHCNGIAVGTVIISQITGGGGGAGTYQVSPNPGSAVGAVSPVFADAATFGAGYNGKALPTLTFSRSFDLTALAAGGSFVNGQYFGNYNNFANQIASYEYDPTDGRYKYRSQGGTQITSALNGGSFTANRQLTAGAGWTLTNTTSAVNATGIDGAANSATTLTASAANGTATIALTQGSVLGTFSAFIKASKITGRLWMTRDGGTNWTDVTAGINSANWTRVSIVTTQTNPTVGFKIENNADAFIIDSANATDVAGLTLPLLTRSADVRASTLSYSGLLPSLPAGRRYALGMKIKMAADWLGASSQPQVSLYPAGSAVTTNGYNFRVDTTGTPGIQSWSASSLQLNYNGAMSAALQWSGKRSVLQAGNMVPGIEYLVEFAFGNGQIIAAVNNQPVYSIDSFGLIKLDPVATLDRIDFTGSCSFADFYLREIRGANVIIWGDSYATEVNTLPNQVRALFPWDEYTVHSRGNAGYGWTSSAGGQLTSSVFSTQVVPYLNSRANSNYLVIWAGQNDLAAGATAAAALASLQTTLTAALTAASAAGVKIDRVIAVSVLPRSSGFSNGMTQATFLTASQLFNSGLSSITGITTVIDLGSVPEFDNANWVSNTGGTWNMDGVHLSPQGFSIVATMIASALR